MFDLPDLKQFEWIVLYAILDKDLEGFTFKFEFEENYTVDK